LTSIPISFKRELKSEEAGRSTAYFPVVGLIIGVILAGLARLLDFILPEAVVNVLIIVTLVGITGALHLDGFADTCDGMAGYKTVEERWRVMRDSRTGAFGVVGLVLLLLAKYVSLNNVDPDLIIPALVFMPVVSRWAMVYAIFAFPYARPEGLGAAYKSATRWPQFAVATAITLAVAAALYPVLSYTGLLVVSGVWLVTTALAFYFKHKFAGLTGDTYGAINEIAEVMALVIVILVATIDANF
jgi:adenosylcobinamide-GDP ribazoletransferase